MSKHVAGDIFEEIEALKKEKNAILLAHYYQEDDIQDIADVIGDSLALAQAAQKVDKDVIVFAGVHFMAETAKILNPERTVVVPDLEAGCSLADSCPAEDFRAFKAKHPDHVVVSYINCSAEVKAESDWICTSSNARRVIDAIPADTPIIFAPDQNLGRYLIRETGREMKLWEGVCIVHDIFSEQRILQLKEEHPEAEIIAHPECQEAILRHAAFVGSTTGLIKRVVDSPAKTFIVATEPGVIHQMEQQAPGKTFLAAPPEDETCSCNKCPFMRLNTLEKIRDCLQSLEPRLEMPAGLRERAKRPLERMLSLG
ncbi:MAG: quinolinate synthase NadA [Deltaproteobacteria bacterium]|nr:quinolinate synthase NadA [Deltaproteobacteria bacterium]